jgi:phosphopantothenoylcysteine decarboxylase/phosphopantothenate--cysteine ligase
MAKRIGLGVTGGIASYKMADLASRLARLDYEVVVMMTESAARFITPLTFRTLTGREVITDLWSGSDDWKIPHIDAVQSLELFVVAPATANIIGKFAHGIADDFLSTAFLAATAPVLVVPAMNTRMYLNPAVQANLELLRQRGVRVLEPASGALACGAQGVGRLPDLDAIVEVITGLLTATVAWQGKRVLINAGPTRESIDPVRYISNRSSGKMGYALARAARARGAEVVLVSGPTALPAPPGVDFIETWEVEAMAEAMARRQADADVIIGAAAVGDFKPLETAGHKLKKTETGRLVLELVATVDILKELGALKRPGQVLVGFAAETDDLLAYARRKLEEKNLDLIVANDVTAEGAGFDAETNVVTLIRRSGDVRALPKMSKDAVAAAILDEIDGLMA